MKLYLGHVTDVLKALPEQSVHCVVTSPPYWALRDYGTAIWEGGKADCDHNSGKLEKRTRETYNDSGNYTSAYVDRIERGAAHMGRVCNLCGAKRIDSQLGSEPTYQEFVKNMVEVFREVRRVLRDDGTLWLNLGDTYASKTYSESRTAETVSDAVRGTDGVYSRRVDRQSSKGTFRVETTHKLPSGNLVGIPWRVALALQDDGWILRQDIIWHKPNPMPESVQNRCTKAHEYLFLLTKKGTGYYYDATAIREMSVDIEGAIARYKSEFNVGKKEVAGAGRPDKASNTAGLKEFNGNRNKRSVWSIPSEPYPGSHFATFPTALVEPCLLAGTSEGGCCSVCGKPLKRLVEEKKLTRERPNEYVKRTGEPGTGNSCSNTVAGVETVTVGWEFACNCEASENLQEIVPCTILDPFVGSGTVCQVALEHGRNSVGIDLSEQYLRENAVKRIEGTLFSVPALRHLVPRTETTIKIIGKVVKPG